MVLRQQQQYHIFLTVESGYTGLGNIVLVDGVDCYDDCERERQYCGLQVLLIWKSGFFLGLEVWEIWVFLHPNDKSKTMLMTNKYGLLLLACTFVFGNVLTQND